MASNNDPNKKDIQDALAELEKYNDALRESINYAKELSKQIEKSTKTLKFSDQLNKSINNSVEDYEKSLKKTMALSEKAVKGKVKEKEVLDQLANLTKEYNEYIKQNAAAFEDGGEILEKQKNIQKDIEDLELAQLNRRGKINSAYHTLDILQEKLAEAEAAAASVNSSTQKKMQQDRAKFFKEKIKEQSSEINFLEKELLSNEKILTQKSKEKIEVDGIINTHEKIVDSYEKQINQNTTLLGILKQQSLLSKLRSKDAEKFNDGLREAAALFAPLVAAFNLIKKFAFGISDQVTKIQKNLVLSRDEAYKVRQEFNDIAVSSGDIAINTNRLIEANIALGQQLGFSSKFTEDLNVQFVKLTKQIGLSEEAAGGLAKISKVTGMTLKETKNVALETSQRLSSQYGIQLNQREVLEDIGKLSSQTLAMFKANPKALAEAVAQTKLLGTNLDNVNKQAKSLLNFETSIENELQAELITGQQLNLERARSAALANDLTTAAKELSNQGINYNKYTNMNAIAQEKVAAALGLSTDELADQLLRQEYMGKSREEIVALGGEEVAKRIEAISAQDKFNLAVEKMQDLIGQVAGGPLGKLVDMIANLMDNSVVLYGVLGAMAALSFTKLVAGLAASAVQAGLLAAGSSAASSALTFGLAAAGIAAGIAVIAAAYEGFKGDAEEAGDMFSSKGKTIVSTKEGGLFKLSENDDMAVAPGIGDILSNANKQTIVAQDNSEMLNILASIRDEMRGTNQGVDKLYNKEAKVNLGAQTIGTAQLMYNTNLA